MYFYAYILVCTQWHCWFWCVPRVVCYHNLLHFWRRGLKRNAWNGSSWYHSSVQSSRGRLVRICWTANGIATDAKKRAVLLSCCGPATFRLLRNLVLPSALDDFSFEELVTKVKQHKEPQPSVIVCRFQFNTRKQHAGESIAEYVAVLRKAAEYCSYGDSLSEMLRDRLVCRITDTTVQ